MKKYPISKHEKETNSFAYVGTMASDGEQRRLAYYRTGCNSFEKGKIKSRPISFWLEKDIWQYIKESKLPYSKIYDMGVHNTGCIFCMFGIQFDKIPNRFQLMQNTHPKLYKYCMADTPKGLGLRRVLKYLNVPYRGFYPFGNGESQ